jgi:hypothetical protein
MDGQLAAIIGLILVVAGICWWLSGFSTRNRKSYELYCRAVKDQEARQDQQRLLYEKSVQLSEEGNRLRVEENGLLRELIAVIREKG